MNNMNAITSTIFWSSRVVRPSDFCTHLLTGSCDKQSTAHPPILALGTAADLLAIGGDIVKFTVKVKHDTPYLLIMIYRYHLPY